MPLYKLVILLKWEWVTTKTRADGRRAACSILSWAELERIVRVYDAVQLALVRLIEDTANQGSLV